MAGRTRAEALLLAAILAASTTPAAAHGFMPDRSYVENGFLHMITAWHLSLPCIALAIAAAETGTATLVTGALFLVGAVAGLFAHPLTPPLFLDFMVPGLFFFSGLALAVPTGAKRWVVPPAALIVGILVSMALYFEGPADDLWLWFAAGALETALPIIFGAWLVWHTLHQSWFTIAGRIIGSWHIAIAVMLAGLSIRYIMEAGALDTNL